MEDIYNSLVTVTQKRYKEMIKTKLYRSIKAELKEIYSSSAKENVIRKKELCDQLNEIYKQYNLNEYSFHNDVKEMQKHFKNSLDSFTAQKLATNLWKSYDKLDRSKRTMNPDNFNEDCTIKKQGNKKVELNKSNRYIKLQNKLKELYRKRQERYAVV